VLEASACARGLATASPQLLHKLATSSGGASSGGGLRLKLDGALLEALRNDLAPALVDLDDEAGSGGSHCSSHGGSDHGGGFGPMTVGRLLPLKLLQLFVPALRYSERCGDAEALLQAVAAENKDAAVWCKAETTKIDALRQVKDFCRKGTEMTPL
jgi:hypothetical protein